MKWNEMEKTTKALVVLLILAIIGSIIGGLGNFAVEDTLAGVFDLVVAAAYIAAYVGTRKRATWAPLLVIVVAVVDVILAFVATDSGAVFGSVIFGVLLAWFAWKDKAIMEGKGGKKMAGKGAAMKQEMPKKPMAGGEEEQEEEGEDEGDMPATAPAPAQEPMEQEQAETPAPQGAAMEASMPDEDDEGEEDESKEEEE